MSKVLESVVRCVANERQVEPKAVLETERLMEIITHLSQDKMADVSASVEMAKLSLKIFDAELAETKRAEEERLKEIRAYWDKKLAEFSA